MSIVIFFMAMLIYCFCTLKYLSGFTNCIDNKLHLARRKRSLPR